jgi:hypothetical protein
VAEVKAEFVVPAKAGTHNPREKFGEDQQRRDLLAVSAPPVTDRSRGRGPDLRRDDG